MALQLTFLFILVMIEVGATRLIYHDGVSRQISRMRNHCRMLAAAMIATACFAASIGFKMHSEMIQAVDSSIRINSIERSESANRETHQSVSLVHF